MMTMMTPDQVIRQAFAAFQAGHLGVAEQHAMSLLSRSPKHTNALTLLGLIAFQRGQFTRALEFQERVIALDARSPEFACNLGFTLMELGRFDDAIRAFQKGRRGSVVALADAGIATACERSGDHDRALRTLESYRARNTTTDAMGVVITNIALQRRDAAEVIAYAEPLRHTPPDNAPARRNILITLGRAYEQLERHDDAFRSFTDANAILAGSFDPAQFLRYTEALRTTFTGWDPSIRSHETRAHPVFIVGMPRSGSTLIEQIIHAHPNGFGAGELPAMSDVLLNVGSTIGAMMPYPSYVPTLKSGHLDQLAHVYLERLPDAAPDVVRIVDKALNNYLHIPMIRRLFPSATIIHARRHPMDICMSCYMHNLSPITHAYTTRLDWLAAMYTMYDDLMHAWSTLDDVHELNIIDVMYERLVDDFDHEARRLIAATGLSWHDDCAAFHTSRRAVTTLSYEQVRQPIYRSALARHERYGAHLDPLRSALSKQIAAYESELGAAGQSSSESE
jgi:tetratricopeptide (TPR) repeat protein